MSSPPSLDPAERERVRSEFFRLVLPAHLEHTAIDFYRLFDLCDAQHRAFKEAPGFPHAIVDDLLTEEGYASVLASVDELDRQPVWEQSEGLAVPHVSAELCLPVPVRRLLGEMGTETFLAAMHSLTGVARLIPDPDRVEDGLVAIPQGSTLSLPASPPPHPRLELFRRTRLTLFLCREWEEPWGGHLELRSHARPGWSERVVARANRCVVWNTPGHARVQHPDPVAQPAGRALHCLTVSFYAPAPTGQKQGQP